MNEEGAAVEDILMVRCDPFGAVLTRTDTPRDRLLGALDPAASVITEAAE